MTGNFIFRQYPAFSRADPSPMDSTWLLSTLSVPHSCFQSFLPSSVTSTSIPLSSSGPFCGANGAKFSFNHCAFVLHKEPEGSGGAILVENLPLAAHDCIFLLNEAQRGGAVHLVNSESSTLVNCIFMDNLASKSSGALLASSSSELQVLNCFFDGNLCILRNSAVSLEKCNSAILKNATFLDNYALHNSALFLSKSSMQADDCAFSGNRGTIATSVLGVNSSVTFRASRFSDSNCVSISVWPDCQLFDCYFSSKISEAISSLTDVKLTNCVELIEPSDPPRPELLQDSGPRRGKHIPQLSEEHMEQLMENLHRQRQELASKVRGAIRPRQRQDDEGQGLSSAVTSMRIAVAVTTPGRGEKKRWNSVVGIGYVIAAAFLAMVIRTAFVENCRGRQIKGSAAALADLHMEDDLYDR